MAQFIKEKNFANLTVDEARIQDICAILTAQAVTAPPASGSAASVGALAPFIIRFDGNGFREWNATQVLGHFHTATQVERLVLCIESADSLTTNRANGSFVEVRLDAADASKNYVVVASDDIAWVNATFGALVASLGLAGNKHGFVRWPITGLLIQVCGVVIGFAISLWAAARMAPQLAIENAFVFSFLFALLIFSNTWGFVAHLIMRTLNLALPNVRFVTNRHSGRQWLMQAIVGSAAFGIAVWIAGLAWNWLATVVAGLMKTSG